MCYNTSGWKTLKLFIEVFRFISTSLLLFPTSLLLFPTSFLLFSYVTSVFSYVTSAFSYVTSAFSYVISAFSYVTSAFSYVTSAFSYVISAFSYVTSVFSYVTSVFSYVTSAFSYVTSAFSYVTTRNTLTSFRWQPSLHTVLTNVRFIYEGCHLEPWNISLNLGFSQKEFVKRSYYISHYVCPPVYYSVTMWEKSYRIFINSVTWEFY